MSGLQADLAHQAEIYRFVASTCLQQTGCTAFQTWGFTDKYSWIPGYTKGEKGAALLYDQYYRPKRAYWALLEVFGQVRPVSGGWREKLPVLESHL